MPGMFLERFREIYFFWLAIILIGILLLLRVFSIIASPLELGGDEAQYWFWSTNLQWGYFSKPPLIAWIIHLFTTLFGHDESIIRLPALLGHVITTICIGFTVYEIHPKRRFLTRTLLIYALMPGVWVSSFVISTDSLLAPSLALFMLALVKMVNTRHQAWSMLVFLALGIAFLAKYAALYFVIGLILTLLDNKELRSHFCSKWTVVGLMILVAIIGPHIIWNVKNSFATVSHTAANANWQENSINFGGLIDFVVNQMAVFGPFNFAMLFLFLLVGLQQWHMLSSQARLLVFLILPPLIIILLQTLLSRAHANWAAMAYLPGSIFLAVSMYKRWHKLFFSASIILHIVVGITIIHSSIDPSFADRIGLNNVTKRLTGWEASIQSIVDRYDPNAHHAILVDDRMLFFQLHYYAKEQNLPIKSWLRHNHPENHAEFVAPLENGSKEMVLVVNMIPNYTRLIEDDFDEFIRHSRAEVQTAKGKKRELFFWKAKGYNRRLRDEKYEEEFRRGYAQ